jgi:uncharacterized protein YbjT (DUF2867 family)
MILLVGASGNLGMAISKQFEKDGLSFKVCSRHPEKLEQHLSPGTKIFKTDLAFPDTFANALQGIETVVLSAHSLLGKGRYSSPKIDREGTIPLIDLSAKAGVKNFVYLSIIGAKADHVSEFFRYKYIVEQHLLKSGMKYAIVRPSAFMEFHIAELIGSSILKSGRVKIFGSDKNPVNFVTVADVATLVSTIIKENMWNEIITIGGPDNLQKRDIAKLYGNELNMTPKISFIHPSLLKVMSKLIKPFHSGVSRVITMSIVLDRIDQSVFCEDVYLKYRISPTSVEQFVRQDVSRYRSTKREK